MNPFNRISHLLLPAVAVSVLFASCIYDYPGDCDEKTGFEIVNDWSLAPAAAPEGMAYLFYPEGSVRPWRFDFPGREAGGVSLPPGEYSFVMFNDDTSDIDFVEDGAGLGVTTEKVSVGFDAGYGDLRRSPDMMWGDASARVVLGTSSLEYESSTYSPQREMVSSPDMRMVTYPRQIVATYNVRVRHVANLHGVAAMKGILGGLSTGMELSTGRHWDEVAGVPFDFRIEADSSVSARFLTFGLPEQGSRKADNALLLFFKLSDGRTERRQFDVTEIVRGAADPLNVSIEIDSVTLPYAPTVVGGGGFDPSVVGWTTVTVNFNV